MRKDNKTYEKVKLMKKKWNVVSDKLTIGNPPLPVRYRVGKTYFTVYRDVFASWLAAQIDGKEPIRLPDEPMSIEKVIKLLGL
jgi:hypothetical protein